MKQVLIVGAGKIGRAFIATLFSQGGYKVCFVDTDTKLIANLNAKGKYRVKIRDRNPETILVDNVRAIHAGNTQLICNEITLSQCIVSCVGLNALPLIAPTIAQGILQKHAKNPDALTDIILAENLRDAAPYFFDQLIKHLPKGFPLHEKVGLVETSIGKMVPILTKRDLDEDPLQIFAESYNSLIVDRKGFKNPLPRIPGLAPKDNIKAWVDRKLFIHNHGHAIAAYFGNLYFPRYEFMYEVLAEKIVLDLTRISMQESGEVLRAIYPDEFNREQIQDHIEDLLLRFQNKALGDTVYRVGSDLQRKLGKSDRIATPIRFACQYNKQYETMLQGYMAALHFSASLDGKQHPGDLYIKKLYQTQGIEFIMEKYSGARFKTPSENNFESNYTES